VDILIKPNGGLELKNILSIENDEEPKKVIKRSKRALQPGLHTLQNIIN